jgi:hypothetical protein
MVAVMRRSTRNLDDDDLFDDEGNGPYDKRYPGQRVIADKGRVRVPILLTDGMPNWMPPKRRQLYDASAHRPHYAVVDQADPHVRDAERAYYERSKMLQDAWRGPANPPPPDDEDDGDLSPRDRYTRNLQTAYRRPIGNGNGADAIEAQRRRWNAEIPAKDAAIADRDVAYDEYIHRLTTAWKRP